MKNLFLIVVAFMLNFQFINAQNSKSEAKPAQVGAKPKQIPLKNAVKPAPASNNTTQAPQNAPNKEAKVNTKPSKPAETTTSQQGKPVLKKDGTPDKRYKENQNLKKDGTPDKRFKENKTDNGKK